MKNSIAPSLHFTQAIVLIFQNQKPGGKIKSLLT